MVHILYLNQLWNLFKTADAVEIVSILAIVNFLWETSECQLLKKSFWSKCLHQGKCFFQSYSISTAVPTCYRPRARNMRDRKNYTHHTIIMKKESSLCGPMPFPEHNACVSSVPLCYSQLLVHHFLHISSLISGSFLSWIEFLLIFYVFTMTFLHIVSPIS